MGSGFSSSSSIFVVDCLFIAFQAFLQTLVASRVILARDTLKDLCVNFERNVSKPISINIAITVCLHLCWFIKYCPLAFLRIVENDFERIFVFLFSTEPNYFSLICRYFHLDRLHAYQFYIGPNLCDTMKLLSSSTSLPLKTSQILIY